MTSVVIPAFNAADILQVTVPAVLALDAVGEIIWVDDGSTDGTADVLAALAGGQAGVRRLTLKSNRGRAAARNAGASIATGEIVVFLDADVEPPPGHARALAVAASTPGAVASVARQRPVVTAPEDPYQDYAAHHPRGPLPHVRDGDVLDWRYFVTGACALRRSALLDAGGFPEDVRYGEDVALRCRLARSHPLGLRLASGAVLLHGLDDLDGALAKLAIFGRHLPRIPRCRESGFHGLQRARPLAPLARAGAPALRWIAEMAPVGPVRRWAVRCLLAATVLGGGSFGPAPAGAAGNG